MKKVLIPYDGTDTNLSGVRAFASSFDPSNWEVLLLHINQNENYINNDKELDKVKIASEALLAPAKEILSNFKVSTLIGFGKSGETTTRMASIENVDLIVITKVKFSRFLHIFGSDTNYILEHSPTMVLSVPATNIKTDDLEEVHTITIPAQTHLGKNKYILPTRPGYCTYDIEVSSGSVSIDHSMFNPDDGRYVINTEKLNDNNYKIAAPNKRSFKIFISIHHGMTDVIEMVNTSLTETATVKYRVTANDDIQ